MKLGIHCRSLFGGYPMKTFRHLAIALAATTVSMAASADAVIDLFAVPQAFMTDQSKLNGTGLWSEVTTAGSTIIGGARDLFVERTGGTELENNGIGVQLGVSAAAPGYMSYSTGANTAGYGYVRWDGDTSTAGPNGPADLSLAAFLGQLNPLGLANTNLAALGSAFELTVLESDLGFYFALEVYTSANQWTRLLVAANQHLSSNPPAVSYIDFVDFETAIANQAGFVLPSGALRYTGSAGGADMSDVGALQAIINPGTATEVAIDLRIDSAKVVPEPSALALVGLGLLGVGVVRRRRI